MPFIATVAWYITLQALWWLDKDGHNQYISSMSRYAYVTSSVSVLVKGIRPRHVSVELTNLQSSCSG
jgi:hypothetical protein